MAADSADDWCEDIEDEEDSGDDDDSWFYASMKRYKNLHMFDLQQPTRVVEWIGQKSICVAGFEKESNNEILELAVPERLLPSAVEEGLNKDRDFKLRSGGFTRRPVWNLRYVPNTTTILSAETGENSVHVYKLGSESSDVINHVFEITNPQGVQSEPPAMDVDGNNVVFGKYLHDLCCADVSSGQVGGRSNHSSNESDISELNVISSGVISVCSKSSGQIHLMDTRDKFQVMQSSAAVNTEPTESATWIMALGTRCVESAAASVNGRGDETATILGCLSTAGQLLIHDARNLKKSLTSVTLPQSIPSDSGGFLKLQFAPFNSGIVSVSGFDGNVCIYDSSSWRGEVPFASPIFVHDGHSAGKRDSGQIATLVTTHCWHPFLPSIVFSAGTDKSLHAWEWQVELE